MKLLVMVSLLGAVISCRADKAPRKINTSINPTSADLTIKPQATIIGGKIPNAYTEKHSILIQAENNITEKFTYAFAINEETCDNANHKGEKTFPTKRDDNGKTQRMLTLTDPDPDPGKRKLCVKGIAKDGRRQEVASTKNWQKTEPQDPSFFPDITATLHRPNESEIDLTQQTPPEVTGNVYVKVIKGSNSTATQFAYHKAENNQCLQYSPQTYTNLPFNEKINISNDTTDSEPKKKHLVCFYGLDKDNKPGGLKEVAWSFVYQSQSMATSNERIQIKDLPKNCSGPKTIELDSSVDQDNNGKITRYKYKFYSDYRPCPASDSNEYETIYNLDQPINLLSQDGRYPQDSEKTLCIIGQAEDDSYIQQKATKHQWFYQQQPSSDESDESDPPGIELSIAKESSLDIVAGTFIPGKIVSSSNVPFILNNSDDQFEWELFVINDSRKAGNIIQVKKTDTDKLDEDHLNDWHNLREHCSIPIVKGSLGAGKKQYLQFKLADLHKTDYGKPYFRTQEIAIRRKGYAKSLRLTVNFKIPKLGMKFPTVTTNEAGIPRITLGPTRKRQQIEITDISGNKIPIQFPGGFGWCQYPVVFKPKWFYRIPECGGYGSPSHLKIGLAENQDLWPDKTKTTRIVVYSNGDSKGSAIGIRNYNTEYQWRHENDDGTKTTKNKRVPRYDSARNFIEIVFDPEL